MRRLMILLLAGAWAAGAAAQFAPTPPQDKPDIPQQRLERPSRPAPRQAHPPVDMIAQRRRVAEVDRLLASGNLSRAESLIDELSQFSWLERDLLPRRIRLAALKGDSAEAATLSREALRTQPRNASLWRGLAEALLAEDQTDAARAALDSFVVLTPEPQNAALVAAGLIDARRRPRMALAFIDSMRGVFGDGRMLAQPRAVGLLLTGRQDDAAAELAAELRANAFNLALVRTGLLDGLYRPADHAAFLHGLRTRAAEAAAVPAEAVLVADLQLAAGDADGAAATVRPLLVQPAGQRALLQNAAALAREIDLVDDPVHNRAAAAYMLAVLDDLSGPDNRDRSLQRRAAQLQAAVALSAMEKGWLADRPAEAADRFEAVLERLRALDPASPDAYAGRIRLAVFRRDRLHEAGRAAAALESLLLDPGLPKEGVAVVRLTLGETYLAAADTARARAVLTSLGRDPEYREAGGHAHFHLARLDLAEGNFVTARDRFAVVAMDNAAAPYANDALDLGLAVAEELDNPSGGPTLLARYAGSVYWDLVGRPDERDRSLAAFIEVARAMATPGEPQRLLERAEWERAQLALDAGRRDEALAMLAALVIEHPDGRYPAPALLQRAQLLAEDGDAAGSRAALEQLLSQYPDWPFADDARDALRSLP